MPARTLYPAQEAFNWSASSWSLADDGAGELVKPTVIDAVLATANSGNPTLDEDAVADSLNMTGFAGTVNVNGHYLAVGDVLQAEGYTGNATLAGTFSGAGGPSEDASVGERVAGLWVFGNLVIAAGTDFSGYTGALTLDVGPSRNMTTNGVLLPRLIIWCPATTRTCLDAVHAASLDLYATGTLAEPTDQGTCYAAGGFAQEIDGDVTIHDCGAPGDTPFASQITGAGAWTIGGTLTVGLYGIFDPTGNVTAAAFANTGTVNITGNLTVTGACTPGTITTSGNFAAGEVTLDGTEDLTIGGTTTYTTVNLSGTGSIAGLTVDTLNLTAGTIATGTVTTALVVNGAGLTVTGLVLSSATVTLNAATTLVLAADDAITFAGTPKLAALSATGAASVNLDGKTINLSGTLDGTNITFTGNAVIVGGTINNSDFTGLTVTHYYPAAAGTGNTNLTQLSPSSGSRSRKRGDY